MRADIREQTLRAAAAELAANDTYIVLVNKAVVDDLKGKWSIPVEFSFHVAEDGLLEMTLRAVDA